MILAATVAVHPVILIGATVTILVGIVSIVGVGAKMVRSQSRVEFNVEQQSKTLSRIEIKQDKESERLDGVVNRLGVVEVKVEGLANQTIAQHRENLSGLWAQGEQMADVLKYMADKAIEAANAAPSKE